MKGIVLAGGSGTRLYPITKGVSKQLLPIHDKPMIYYPIAVLLEAGIRDILIISTPDDLPSFKKLLGDGSDLGVNFFFKEQHSPDGLAQAFLIGEDFIGSDDVCLVLGDNIFHGEGLKEMTTAAIERVKSSKEATVFGYWVSDPQRYGVVSFDKNQQAINIEEKPTEPQSNYAVTGLYFYPNSVIDMAKKIRPSTRGELEITAVNAAYIDKGDLYVQIMGKGYAWLDTGTHQSLLEASNYIQAIENRQGLKVACLEEIAFKNGYIDANQILKLAESLRSTSYGQYLFQLVKR